LKGYITNADKDMQKLEPSLTAGGKVKMVQKLWKMWDTLKYFMWSQAQWLKLITLAT
jgi:hypothetical protein